MSGPPARVLTRRTLPLYAAAWLPLVAAYAVGISAYGVPRADALVSAAMTVLSAALLGAVALEAAARLAAGRPGVGRLVGSHVARAAVYATAWVGSTALQMLALAPPETLGRYMEVNAPWEWASGLFLYGVVAGVGHAAEVGRQLREREAAATRAELHALRAQLDPHFLFNTLHSLTALARRDPAAVERGLETFGALLRYVLDANRGTGDDVALADEMAFVRDYLSLERLRLGDRLRVEESLDDEALECAVPAYTLQPLVENAIRHGIAPRASGGTLRIEAELDDAGLLALVVADDGAGCDPETPVAGRGLGLALVRRRLAARFGTAARSEVVTAPAGGFRVRLSLPGVPTRPRAVGTPRHGASDAAAPVAAVRA